MPLETLESYRHHGEPAVRLGDGLPEAQAALAGLKAAGIDLDSVTQQLEDEGISKFNKPFDQSMETLKRAREAALSHRLAALPADRSGDTRFHQTRFHPSR